MKKQDLVMGEEYIVSSSHHYARKGIIWPGKDTKEHNYIYLGPSGTPGISTMRKVTDNQIVDVKNLWIIDTPTGMEKRSSKEKHRREELHAVRNKKSKLIQEKRKEVMEYCKDVLNVEGPKGNGYWVYMPSSEWGNETIEHVKETIQDENHIRINVTLAKLKKAMGKNE